MPCLAQSINGRNMPILCHYNPPLDHDGMPTAEKRDGEDDVAVSCVKKDAMENRPWW